MRRPASGSGPASAHRYRASRLRRVPFGCSATSSAEPSNGTWVGSTTTVIPSMSSSSRSSVGGERGLDGAATPTDHDLTGRTRGQGVDRVVGGIGGGHVRVGQQQHPGDVERDVAGADDHGPLGVEIRCEPDVVGVAVVPADEVGRGDAAGEVLAGDAETAFALRSDGVEHGVVALEQFVAGDVGAEVDVTVEPEPGSGGDLFVLPAHRLDLRVVGGHAGAHETPRGGQPVVHVDPDLRFGRVEEGPRGVEARRAGTDDGDAVSPHAGHRGRRGRAPRASAVPAPTRPGGHTMRVGPLSGGSSSASVVVDERRRQSDDDGRVAPRARGLRRLRRRPRPVREPRRRPRQRSGRTPHPGAARGRPGPVRPAPSGPSGRIGPHRRSRPRPPEPGPTLTVPATGRAQPFVATSTT